MKRKKKKLEDILLDSIIYLIMIVLLAVTLYPMWFVLIASFVESTEVVASGGILLWPQNPSLEPYKLLLQDPFILTGYLNTIKILVLALPINIVGTVLAGYFLASTNMMFKKPVVLMMLFTMYFSGGMIPAYLNIRDLELLNSHWSLILPGMVSVTNCIICKTAIEGIPQSLPESAYLDGASDIQVMFKIIMPLIKPTLAVLLLYYGVGHWNSWFAASIYIKDNDKLPIQNILRDLLMRNVSSSTENAFDKFDQFAETVKYSAVIVATVPILCIYPFLQKYFVKGVMIGAVKG